MDKEQTTPDGSELLRTGGEIPFAGGAARAESRDATASLVALAGDDARVGDDARTRILAAAGPVFARRGFDRATVREICREANVNVASVGYYFGDKMGLYRQVIRQIHENKERRFPSPADSDDDPGKLLHLIIRTILSRMLAGDASGWESQLMMREMQQPTAIFGELVEESFRPMFNRLVETFRRVVAVDVSRHELERFAFSVVGQCLYFRFGAGVIQRLVPEATRREHYDIESLSRHITAVMLAAAESGRAIEIMNHRFEYPTITTQPNHE